MRSSIVYLNDRYQSIRDKSAETKSVDKLANVQFIVLYQGVGRFNGQNKHAVGVFLYFLAFYKINYLQIPQIC